MLVISALVKKVLRHELYESIYLVWAKYDPIILKVRQLHKKQTLFMKLGAIVPDYSFLNGLEL